jgi:hypothetical protein
MPSIIPTFGYDIFISYRHNDNRSGWVTELVNALQEELAFEWLVKCQPSAQR